MVGLFRSEGLGKGTLHGARSAGVREVPPGNNSCKDSFKRMVGCDFEGKRETFEVFRKDHRT